MKDQPGNLSTSKEIERIRFAYVQRAKEIPKDFYSLNNTANLFAYMQRVRVATKLLAHENFYPLDGKEILEIGCGTAGWLIDFLRWGAEHKRLYGIDLDEARIQNAKARLPEAGLRTGEASHLPWKDQSFDIVLQSTVFTSILSHSLKMEIAREMVRVLKPSGFILWYDFRFNNPRNSNVRGIEAKEIRSLFPSCDVKLKKITLAPPLARFLAPISWTLCSILSKIPLLNTHYISVIRKR